MRAPWEEPLVIAEEPVGEWPDPPAEEAFHGLAGDFVRLVEPHTEADRAALLLDFLVLAGAAIGRTAHVRVGAQPHYPNLFGVVVGGSGAAGRKGTAFSEAQGLFSLLPHKAVSRRLSGIVSGEGILWSVRDPVYRTETDKKTSTTKDVMVDPGVPDKRLVLREAEFAQVLRVAGRDNNTTSVQIREAWDGAEVLQTAAKNNPVTATAPHIAMLGDITPTELRRELTDTNRANGFANRILWCCSRRSKLLPDGGSADPVDLGWLADRLRVAILDAQAVRQVARDEEANALWRERYHDLTRERHGLLGALLARSEAQVLRLSLLYALLDGHQVIRREHLEAALAMWDYVERSTEFIFGDAVGDPVADELLEVLRRTPDGMTRTEIRDHFGRHRKSDAISRALSELERAGLVRCEREETGGRPSERWFAVVTS